MAELISYVAKQEAHADEAKVPVPTIPSGVACSESWCSGEMYYVTPEQQHPQHPQLKRAQCNDCQWWGWC